MSKTPTVKILVAYHKPSYLLKSDVFVPIHVGRAVANMKHKDGALSSKDIKWLKKNLIGDDTGENISLKNRNYCEATAIYWAWKNYDKLGNPDYIGLAHYRRFFILNEKYEKHFANDLDERWNVVHLNTYTKTILKKAGITSNDIYYYLGGYDAIVTPHADLKRENISNVKDDYAAIGGLKAKDFDLLLETVSSMYPEYIPDVRKLADESSKHMYNMFVMKRDLFMKYCSFLFSVLFELDKKIDFSDYDINGKRSLGYLAELLTTLFIFNMYRKNYKLKECGILYSDSFTSKIDIFSINIKYMIYKLSYRILKFPNLKKKLQKYNEKLETIYNS